MWIVAKEDKYVASTWGASVSLKANEPKQVAKDLGLLCLQHGCEEVQDGAQGRANCRRSIQLKK